MLSEVMLSDSISFGGCVWVVSTSGVPPCRPSTFLIALPTTSIVLSVPFYHDLPVRKLVPENGKLHANLSSSTTK